MATKKKTPTKGKKKTPARKRKTSKGTKPPPVETVQHPKPVDGIVRCGSTDTHNGKPCRQVRLPCRHHDPKFKDKPRHSKKTTQKLLKFADKVAAGKKVIPALVEAGFAKTTAKSKAHNYLHEDLVRDRIAARLKEAENLDKNEVIGTLVSGMRGDMYDILPDNEVVQQAHERGVSHLLSEVRETKRLLPQGTGKPPIEEVKTTIKMLNPLECTKQLAKIMTMEKLPAPNEIRKRDFQNAVDELLEEAKIANITNADGSPVTRQQAEEKLRPLFGDSNSHAVN